MITEESLSFLDKVCSKMHQHHAPFWGTYAPNLFFRKNGEDYVGVQGTMTFISYDGRCFGLTCDHVLKNAISHIGEDYIVWMIGTLTRDSVLPKESLIFRGGDNFDLAIFELPCDFISRGNKKPLTIHPNRYNTKIGEETLLICGYPGEYRYQNPNNKSQRVHELSRIVLTCHMQNDSHYYLENTFKPENILAGSTGEEGIAVFMGGISGGGLYRLETDSDSYSLVGIIHSSLPKCSGIDDIFIPAEALPIHAEMLTAIISKHNGNNT